MVINYKHYCINNSTWYLKFDLIEDYNKIKNIENKILFYK